MKQSSEKIRSRRSERGQAIVLIAAGFIGLVAMVGLVTDTGLVLIEYGKLKRSVDSAAVAAAQEFRPDPDTGNLNMDAMVNAARSFLLINQIENVRDVVIHTCEDTGEDRPDLCNPDPEGNPIANRKLVEVTAKSDVGLAFLRVLGINSVELTVTSIGEASTIDLVLLIDTSGSMAYETSGALNGADPGDDPRICNAAQADSDLDGDLDPGTCQPMRAVQNVALDFVDSLIYFGYDRVSIITMTQQAADISDAVERDPTVVLPLEFDENSILFHLDNLKVFQPRICDGSNLPGECLQYISGTYNKPYCEIYESAIGHSDPGVRATADPSSCPSSNIGGMLALAQNVFSGTASPDPNSQPRADSLWVTVLLASGPANASTPSPADVDDYPYGYCPQNTWLFFLMPDPKPKWCRDAYPSNERSAASPLVSYENPISHELMDISEYDAEDYARDMADGLAALKTRTGVTIYTIGLGENVGTIQANGSPAVTCEVEVVDAMGVVSTRQCGEAEYLLSYIARDAGDAWLPTINHGNYFYAPTDAYLRNIFEIIAQNIATKISQ